MKEIPDHIKKLLKFEYDEKLEAAPEIGVKYSPPPAPCEDCGRIVTDRRIWIKRYFAPFDHWREICKGCDKIKNPTTGQFEVDFNLGEKFVRSNRKAFLRDK